MVPRLSPSGVHLRAVVGGLLVTLALLGVSQAHAAADRPPGDRVVVARRTLAPGATLDPDALAVVAADLPSPTADRLFASVDAVVGATTLAPLAAGEPILLSQVLPAGADPAPGVDLAFGLAAERALAGTVRPGEAVDVVATRPGRPSRPVATAALVLAVATGGDGLLGGDDRVVLTVRVADRREALALVDAVDTGEVTVVRPSGATGP